MRIARKPLSKKQAITRGKQFKITGYKKWIDPFPYVVGTVPEKMVYAELSRRGIPFWFQNEVAFNRPDLDFFKNYRPDFVLPDLKIIIEVQGAYWHSKAATVESDATKFAVYNLMGWQVLAWWDYDIERDLTALFNAEPKLQGGFGIYRFIETVGGKKIIRDDTKGVVTQNYKRGLRLQYRKKAVKRLYA